ncbi:hypothetical protein E2P61_03135 [Candidatus Bathyarchaeota archaeon]|nr:hypothetical protein E2P61_03135 [Candidatus Bathyarchaeota archaeon]
MKKVNITRIRVKIATFIITLLMILYFAPLCLASAGAEQGLDANKTAVPGVPDNAVQYNKTDVTPVAEMEQVTAGEPALFCYRNTTILMNCTRNCQIILTADPQVTPKIFGFSIDPNQTMTLTMNLSGSPLNGAQTMEKTLNFYFSIEPNATLQLNAQLKLHINQTELSQQLNREVDKSKLTWMYWNRTMGEWETVESYIDQNNYLVCNTDHFSTWTVAEIDTEEALELGLNLAYIYAAISLVVIVVLAVSIVAFKKRS